VNKAGDFLSAILDSKTINKAGEYSKLFSVWEQLAKKYGIAAAAHHSRIHDVQHGILIITADHPGWIQILQTKEHALLSDVQKTFPSLDLNGIAFKLSKTLPDSAETACVHEYAPYQEDQRGPGEPEPAKSAHNAGSGEKPLFPDTASAGVRPAGSSGFERIKDKALKDTLKSLEQTIKSKNKGRF
jgi:hypothetical protein